METEHIVTVPVRAYLLGKLADRDAVALEEKYFMDPSFFRRVQAVEQGLIEDYLDNRLPRPERRQFESRYLTVPTLRRRLEEVRAQRATSTVSKSTSGWAWRPLVLAGVIVCVVGMAAWIYVHQHRSRPLVVTQAGHPQEHTSQPHPGEPPAKPLPENVVRPPVVAQAEHPQPEEPPARVLPNKRLLPPPVQAGPAVRHQEHASQPQPVQPPAKALPDNVVQPPEVAQTEHPDDQGTLTVSLTPKPSARVVLGKYGLRPIVGDWKPLSKPRFQLPPAGGQVRLVVDFRGKASIVSCTPQILILLPDKRWDKVWSSSEIVASQPVEGGQEVTVTVDSSLLHSAADYALQLVRPEMPAGEFYRFYVTGPQ